MHDDMLMPAQVTALVAKCGERGSDGVQLAVVRALLTLVTADHFVLHGESLMQVCSALRF